MLKYLWRKNVINKYGLDSKQKILNIHIGNMYLPISVFARVTNSNTYFLKFSEHIKHTNQKWPSTNRPIE